MNIIERLPSSYRTYASLAVATFLILALLSRTSALPWLRRSPTTKAPSAQRPPPVSTSEKDTGTPRSPSDYADIFPPSNRDGLRRVRPSAAAEVDPTVFRLCLMGWEEDWRRCDAATILPSGIALGEVRALGDFPDYATLSGVPLPDRYEGFVLERATHRPYRPFRWEYHQTMALQKLEPNWWLELEQTYAATVAQRLALYDKYPDSILQCLPGAELAAKETMEMALQFYCARYPQYFSLSESTERGWVFHNGILGHETVLAELSPLHVLLRNIPEDFALMLRHPGDGRYYLRAGVICSSLGWNLGTKIGLPLSDVHEPVPEYAAKLEFSMDRFFAKLPPSKPIQRGAWGFEIDKPLFTAPDAWDSARATQDPSLTRARIHLRVDWQTLRRLPLSGAVAFNYKAVFTPLAQLAKEPYAPALILKVLIQGKTVIKEYKSTWHTAHITVPALREYVKEQEDSGMVERDWDVSTLAQSPFYPGWEDVWREEQGF